MSSFVSVQIDTNAAEVARQVRAFPPAMAQGIAAGMDEENELTVGQIQARKLSRRGPTTLGVRSNRLRPSVRRSAAVVSGLVVDSSIGSNVAYAGVHEHGIDKNVTVRAHSRRILSYAGDGRRTYSRMDSRGRIRTATRKGTLKGTATVRQHTRHMKFPARAYISSTITERAANYSATLSAAILTAWQNPQP